MATSSTVTAFKAALIDAVSGVLTDVQVSHGYPGEAFIKREAVYVDRVSGRHQVANIKAGRKHRDETYSVTVVVSVVKDRGKVIDVETRALELLSVVEDVVADDPSIGDVDGLVYATAGDFRMISDPTKNGVACVIEFDIDVRARLV